MINNIHYLYLKCQSMNILSSSSSSSDDENVWFVRRRKIYRIRENHLEKYDALDFFQRFRITKDTFQVLLSKIEDRIRNPTNR